MTTIWQQQLQSLLGITTKNTMIHVDFLPQTHTCIHAILYTSIYYTHMSAKRNKHIQTHTHIYIYVIVYVHIYIVHGSCLLHDHPQLILVSYLRPPKSSNGASLRPGVQNGASLRVLERRVISCTAKPIKFKILSAELVAMINAAGCNMVPKWLWVV